MRSAAALVLICAACSSRLPLPPDVLSIEPSEGSSHRSTTVSIGGRFEAADFVVDYRESSAEIVPLTVRLGEQELEGVRIVAGDRVDAVVPAGMAEGTYPLIVTDPHGQSGVLDDAFTVGAPRVGPRTPPLLTSSVAPSPPPPDVRVQRGSVTLAGETSASVRVEPVDVARSILFFSVRVDTIDAAVAQVRGTLSSSTSIDFSRWSAGGPSEIEWYLAELEEGVSVQRGVVTPADDSSVVNITIAPVDRTKSFPLISFERNGTRVGANDYMRARLVADDLLEISVGEYSVGGTLDWQVVTIEDATVQSGDVTLAFGESSRTISVQPFDPTSSFLLTTWNATGEMELIGCHMVRTAIAGPGQLLVERLSSSSVIGLTWFLVSRPGMRVQSGTQSFGALEAMAAVELSPVDDERSVAIVSGHQRIGSTRYVTRSDDLDNPGVAWFSADLASKNRLVLSRAVTSTVAEVGWFVIEL